MIISMLKDYRYIKYNTVEAQRLIIYNSNLLKHLKRKRKHYWVD
jgi:hypothetical protein